MTWSKNRGSDAVFMEYRREYKKRFARIKRGTVEPDVFYAWGEDGKLSLEEFSDWLKQS